MEEFPAVFPSSFIFVFYFWIKESTINGIPIYSPREMLDKR